MTSPATVLFAVTLGAACAGRPFRSGPAEPELPRVEYVGRSFHSALAGCNDPASGAPAACVAIEIDYVEVTHATVGLARSVAGFVGATVLRSVADAGPAPDVEVLRDELYETYREIQRHSPDYRVPWRLKRTVTVACNTERVQGLVATEQSFTGGARPIERVTYRSFDTRTGEAIGLDALVAPERRAELLDALAGRARGAPGQDLWSRTPDAPAPAAIAPDDLLVCPDALTVRWGGGDVVVPRDEIRPLLRDDAP